MSPSTSHAPNVAALAPADIGPALADAVAALPFADIERAYAEQDAMVVVERFLPEPLTAALVAEARAARPHVHRSYLPRHKKGGSVSRVILEETAPATRAVYEAPALRDLFRRLSGAPRLDLCPVDDPHAFAIYWYSDAGDHIGWHYDTSYYKANRYTALIGLVDRSSSRLECRLFTRLRDREQRELSLATAPGSLVFFDGDRLLHRVTPLGDGGEERIVLTMEFVIDPRMGRFLRFVSNMKDAIAYFGFGAVLGRRGRGTRDREGPLKGQIPPTYNRADG